MKAAPALTSSVPSDACTITPRNSVKRPDVFGPVRQARAWRAKTKSGQDAGSVNGSAIRVTEDAPRRRFAAASSESGSPDRAQLAAPRKASE